MTVPSSRLLAVAAIVCATVALVAAPAYAHATLQETNPAQSTLYPSGRSPATATLRFDESVAIPAGAVQVFDGRGKPVKIGRVAHGANDRILTAGLPALADGTYVVTWRIVSQDSHPIQGAFTFSVGKATATTTNVKGLLAGRGGSRTIGVLFGVDRALVFLSVLVLLGGIAFVRWSWPDARQLADVMTLLWVALGLVVASSIAAIAFQGAYVNGHGISGLFDGSSLRGVMHTHFGKAALARAVIALGLAAAFIPARRAVRYLLDGWFVVGALATCATFAYAGHGDTGRFVGLGFLTDVVHLAAASLWLGGIAVLAVGLRDPSAPRGAARAAGRFSAIAMPAVLVITLSGSVQAWRQIETWPALWHTAYARLLLAKVVLVGAIVVAASVSRDVLRLRLVPTARAALAPGAQTREAAPEPVRDLRNAIWVEIVLAVVVLAITAGLMNAQPAREAAAATPRTVTETVKADRVWFDIAVQPALPGDDTIVVTPRTPGRGPARVIQLNGSLALPGRVAPIPLTFVAINGGRYASAVQVPIAGKWRLTLKALRTQVDESSASLVVRFGG